MNKDTILTIVLVWCILIMPFRVPVAHTCQLCVPYPETTLTDRLLQNDEIIFARELPDSPYLFYPTEIIRGGMDTEPFKMFCDSFTRRKLSIIPGSAVVLAKRTEDEKWHFITFADIGFQSFIRTLISVGGEWSAQPNDRDRLQFFAKALNSEHSQIHIQAYLEVGRAPYSLIKTLAKEIDKTKIYDLLRDYRFIEWHNLYILILGQSRDAEDLKFIRDKVESTARFGTTQSLAAWITAFIESHPENGVAEVERLYFKSPNRTKGEIEQVMASMSVLGSQTTSFNPETFKLRSRIVRSYRTLLDNYPEMSGNVAQNLAAWRVRAHVEQIAEIRKEPGLLDPAAAYSVDYYLSMAPGL